MHLSVRLHSLSRGACCWHAKVCRWQVWGPKVCLATVQPEGNLGGNHQQCLPSSGTTQQETHTEINEWRAPLGWTCCSTGMPEDPSVCSSLQQATTGLTEPTGSRREKRRERRREGEKSARAERLGTGKQLQQAGRGPPTPAGQG